MVQVSTDALNPHLHREIATKNTANGITLPSDIIPLTTEIVENTMIAIKILSSEEVPIALTIAAPNCLTPYLVDSGPHYIVDFDLYPHAHHPMHVPDQLVPLQDHHD